VGEIVEHHTASSGHPKEYPYFKKVSALACLKKNERSKKKRKEERDKKKNKKINKK